MDDELSFEPSETELTLYTLSSMVDTLMSQLLWLQVLIEEELERLAEAERFEPP